MQTLQLTDASFDAAIIKPGTPAMVDLWAPWCGPCRSLMPVVEELAAEYAGKVSVGKLNTDENAEVPARFRVAAIPTLLFFSRGRLMARLVGTQPKAEVRRQLEVLLGTP